MPSLENCWRAKLLQGLQMTKPHYKDWVASEEVREEFAKADAFRRNGGEDGLEALVFLVRQGAVLRPLLARHPHDDPLSGH